MPVAALVEAGALFGLTGNHVRVTLRRLCEEGRAARLERGLYQLSEPAARVNRRVRAWSRPPKERRWDGRWWVLAGAECADQTLRLYGFAAAGTGLAVRPANLALEAGALLVELRDLGVPEEAELMLAQPADPACERRWRGLWDGAALARAHDETSDALASSLEGLDALAERDALRETYLQGGAAVHQLAFDPVLPESIAPSEPRERLRTALLEYDRVGRRHWGAFMARFGLSRRSQALHAAPSEAPLVAHLLSDPTRPEEAA